MELTPQLLETQQFPEKWRGYDQDAVDEFLERVGVGLAELQDRLRTKSARLDELEGGDGHPGPDDTTAERDISDQLGSEPDAPQQAVGERSVSEDSEVSAVARTLVLAQKAADQALAEAASEGRRIAAAAATSADLLTAEATADADRMLREATVRHDAATSRLADVDGHIASLVDEALREARAEGSRLVSDAESRAKILMGEAEVAAERVRKSETESEENRAKKATADAEVAARRQEAEALQVEIDERQTQLRSLIDGLQTLVEPGGPAVTEPAGPDEPVSGVTIDLTTDQPRVDHTAVEDGGQLRSLASSSPDDSSGPMRQTGPAATAPSTWASLEDPSPKVPPRRGLTVVSAPEEDDVSDTVSSTAEQSQVASVTTATVVDDSPSDEQARAAAPTNGSAAVDDPFLAALRGPDRVEFDQDGEPDADESSFKRRRRRL